MRNVMAVLAGLLFGLGLVLGGMTQPSVVLGFLDIFGAWNPRLLFVIGGAVLTAMIGYRLVLRRAKPWLDSRFHLPDTHRIDLRLLTGAALFGIGWGVAGYCPGPALVSLSGGALSVWILVAAMVAGWWLAGQLPTGVKRR
ncbi:YeeE/YedE family protein [Dyella acidisoli]